jgi:polysaccharide pyruvyl transferase WcaK-like protein
MWKVCRDRFRRLNWVLWDELIYRYSPQRYMGHAKQDKAYIIKAALGEIRTRNKSRMLMHKLLHRWAASRGGESALLGGGTLINREDLWLDAYRSLRRRVKKPVFVFGTGVANPELWISEPGWVDKRREWVSLLAELPVVGVRGPTSKALLEEAGATNVVISGDPAAALHRPRPAGNESGPPRRELHIGINCGFCGRMWGTAAAVNEILAETGRELIRCGHSVELFSVWPDDTNYCHQVARQIGESALKPVRDLSSLDGFMSAIRMYDLVIAFKLHAGVLAAAANVPVIILEYQPKCLDFALSAGWDRFTIRTSQLTRQKLLDMVYEMASGLGSIREELCKAMCGLSGKFAAYCDAIEGHLLR